MSSQTKSPTGADDPMDRGVPTLTDVATPDGSGSDRGGSDRGGQERQRPRRIKEPPGDRMFVFCIYLLLTVFLLVVLLPLAYIVASSFSSPVL